MKSKLIQKLKHYAFPVALIALFPLYALAADPTNPDVIPAIMALWAAIQAKASTSMILVPVFQILRSNQLMPILAKFTGKWMRVAVAAITAGGYVAEAWAKGGSLGNALVTGLLVGGGAMLIYDAFRDMKAPTPAPQA